MRILIHIYTTTHALANIHTCTHTCIHQVMRPLYPEEREQQNVPGVGEYGGTYFQKYWLSFLLNWFSLVN
jgi:hypothetical protein